MPKCPIKEPQTNLSVPRSLDPATDGWTGLATNGRLLAAQPLGYPLHDFFHVRRAPGRVVPGLQPGTKAPRAPRSAALKGRRYKGPGCGSCKRFFRSEAGISLKTKETQAKCPRKRRTFEQNSGDLD